MLSIYGKILKISRCNPNAFIVNVVLIILTVNSCQFGKQVKQSQVELEGGFVLDWDNLTYAIAYEHDKFYSLIGIRALTMVHLAMHDALNAIEPQYEQYAYLQKHDDADPLVAASQAAYEVLIKIYPSRKDTIILQLNKCLKQVAESSAKKSGIEIGINVAKAIIHLRQGDGHEKQDGYTPMTKPGDYQYTPGWNNWVLKPDFSYATPFALDTVTQFRSPDPPNLTSEIYTKSYEEVKAYGMKSSTVRSLDQTHYAHWWAEFAEHSWNRIGRIAAKKHHLSAWEAARMFALINVDIYDIYLASLESKYFYDTWRPYTAIREADSDNNPQTIPIKSWEPEMLTPPWPEYPSAHAAVGAGGAEILRHVFGTSAISFTMESTSALPQAKTRTYNSLIKAADDCADSRIMNGYHFRFATEEGKRQGLQIAKFVHGKILKPLD
ncbi:MAG: phosphoesterase PA-phosphatase [Bacteroidota bacterium]